MKKVHSAPNKVSMYLYVHVLTRDKLDLVVKKKKDWQVCVGSLCAYTRKRTRFFVFLFLSDR